MLCYSQNQSTTHSQDSVLGEMIYRWILENNEWENVQTQTQHNTDTDTIQMAFQNLWDSCKT